MKDDKKTAAALSAPLSQIVRVWPESSTHIMTLHTRRKSSPDWQSISSVWATFPNTLSLLRCNSVSRQNATAWAIQSLESLPSVQALFNQSVSLTCKGIISQYTEKLLRGGRQHTYSWHLQSIHKSQRLPRHDQTWSTGGREKKKYPDQETDSKLFTWGDILSSTPIKMFAYARVWKKPVLLWGMTLEGSGGLALPIYWQLNDFCLQSWFANGGPTNNLWAPSSGRQKNHYVQFSCF